MSFLIQDTKKRIDVTIGSTFDEFLFYESRSIEPITVKRAINKVESECNKTKSLEENLKR